MASSVNVRAHFALLGTQVFFAINYSSIKYLTGNGFMGPFGLNLMRVIVALILLWGLFLFNPRKIIIKKHDYWRFFLASVTGIVINQLLFVKGLSMTYSIHATLLMLATPILITFVAAWLLKERLNIFKISGLILGISGALILVLNGRKSLAGSNVLLGDIFVIVNAVSYAFYFIIVKPLMKEYDPLLVLRIIFTIGFFLMLPFCQHEFMQIQWNSLSQLTIINILLITVGGTFLAYLFNIYGLKQLGASVAGTYIYAQPVMTTIISMVFMNEKMDSYKVIAGMLIFVGVYLANKKHVETISG